MTLKNILLICSVACFVLGALGLVINVGLGLLGMAFFVASFLAK